MSARPRAALPVTFVDRHAWWLSSVLTVWLTLGWLLLPPLVVKYNAELFLLLFVLAASLSLGWRGAVAVLSSSVVVVWSLSQINSAKIAMTQGPLTTLDFRIFAANPTGLWHALNWPVWTFLPAAAFVVLVALAAGVAIAVSVRRRFRADAPVAHRRQALFSTVLGIIGLTYFTASLPRIVAESSIDKAANWRPEGLAEYSRQIGTVPFLLYSSYLERQNFGLFYSEPDGVPPSRTEIMAAVRRHVQITGPPPALPNIVVLFAESTFDPNRAFVLTRPVKSRLFEWQPDTHAMGGLFMNAVGGGSWISEFETIVGVDSRLFGYAGHYTHSTLSPFVRKSIFRYLEDKGYTTTAHYPWNGNFYNARRGYANYGVRQFFEVSDLSLQEFSTTDPLIVTSVIDRLKTTPAPFFGYVILEENHSPHTCKHFSLQQDLATTFVVPAPFAMNCELNEYVRRLGSTEQAVTAMTEYLQEVQRTTGRPYVLLTFGDHQPHTFTSSGAPRWSSYDFQAQRTSASTRETFFHFESSAVDVIDCCEGALPPATLLPTLLSAYTASGLDDLYLPESFYLYEHCGSDMLKRTSRRLDGSTPSPCEEARRRWLTEIRRQGVFGPPKL